MVRQRSIWYARHSSKLIGLPLDAIDMIQLDVGGGSACAANFSGKIF